MNIKPRSASGHLLSVHGKKDFLILEMVNGTIRFMIRSNKGTNDIETSYKPPSTNSFCDGNWHNIRGTLVLLTKPFKIKIEVSKLYSSFLDFSAIKQKNVLLLSVDHKAATPGIGTKNSASVSTKSPVFIGGHLRLQAPLRGSLAKTQYVGCMNNIVIDMKPIRFDPNFAYGKVTTNVCPTI